MLHFVLVTFKCVMFLCILNSHYAVINFHYGTIKSVHVIGIRFMNCQHLYTMMILNLQVILMTR